MLPYRTHGTQGPTIVLLHWLGGSSVTWTEVAGALAARGLRSIAIDLPGFGDAVANPRYTVEAMADEVLANLRGLDAPPTNWLLAGHSMGGKVAAVLTRSLLDNISPLAPPSGIVLVSPSPPGPEPMKDSKRAQMLDSLGQSTGDATEERKRAEAFVDDNTGKLPLDAALRTRTVDDVLRMSRAAFNAWLIGDAAHEAGSREDWSTRVGVLPIPTLIFAGTEDAALGPDAQQHHTVPHFDPASLITLEACGHLGPLERASELTEHIVSFAQSLGLALDPPTSTLSPGFSQLLHSVRTSPRTHAVMLGRLSSETTTAQIFTEPERRTLRALVETVIPSAGFDLTAPLERSLAAPQADGWRFDTLPPDPAAWQQGLASLDAAVHRAHGVSFLALTPSLRYELLAQARAGDLGRGVLGTLHLGDSASAFTAGQMQQWFEDVRAQLTRLYVSDPRTLDRIGFTGFADDPAGFAQIRLEDQQATPEELLPASTEAAR
jgi:pimeloyl-ACP methyl ester carboxylesterase